MPFFPISDENDVITRQRGCEIFKKMFLAFVKLNFRKSQQFSAKKNHFSDYGVQKCDRGGQWKYHIGIKEKKKRNF